MTLGELRDLLNYEYENLPDTTPVVICIQPSYPLRMEMAGAISTINAANVDLEEAMEQGEDVPEAYRAALELPAMERGEAVDEAIAQILEEKGIRVELRLLARDCHPREGSPYADRRDWDLL